MKQKRYLAMLLTFLLLCPMLLCACQKTEPPAASEPEGLSIIWPQDDGTRTVTVQYFDYTSEGKNQTKTYDLSGTPDTESGPVITLYRGNMLLSVVYDAAAPVSHREDREWILSVVENAVFAPSEEFVPWSMMLTLEENGTTKTYYICANGTFYRLEEDGSMAAAAEPVEYTRFSALAYKYGVDAEEAVGMCAYQWFAEVTAMDGSALPKDSYRLCIEGVDFRKELDRAQAQAFLQSLFGTDAYSKAVMPMGNWYAAELSRTISTDCVRFTEILKPKGSPWETYLPEGQEELRLVMYLYPDGTLAQVGSAAAAYSHPTLGYEQLTPSWVRTAVRENSFDPQQLRQLLEQNGMA